MMSWIFILLCYFSLPLVLLKLDYFNLSSVFSDRALWTVIRFTLYQAFGSAALSIVLGLLCAPAYAKLGRLRQPVRWILLLPNMMSPVLVVLALLSSFEKFPFGLVGIFLGHIYLNWGLATVWLGEHWEAIERQYRPVAQVYGAGDFFFFRKVIFPQMARQTLNSFTAIFSFCMASFAIPLTLGGGPQSSTIEVFIFERIHVDGDISTATFLSLFQGVLQFGIFFLVIKPILLKREYQRQTMKTPPSPLVWMPLFLVLAFTIYPLVQVGRMASFVTGTWKMWTDEKFIKAVETSVATSLFVGALVFFVLWFLAAFGFKKVLPRLPVLSGVTIGLGLFFILNAVRVYLPVNLWVLVFALTLGHLAAFLPAILRLAVTNLEQIRKRFEPVLVQLGAPKPLGLKKVYLPTGLKTYVSGGVLGVCWSMGEFSVSKMVGVSQATLPLYVSDLLASYRLENAAAVSILLLVLSIIAMTAFEVVTNGLD